MLRAEALHGGGDLSQAETLYRAILAQRPDHARALHNLGVIALRLGQASAAEGLFRHALALEADMAEAYSNLGLALAGLDRPVEAREAFQTAVTLRPDFADAWSNLAILDQGAGDPVAAIENFRRALAVDQSHGAIAANLGAALIEAGDLDEGIGLLERVLPRFQHVAPVQFNLGKGRFLQGDLAQAIDRLRQAVALEPGFADAHHTLGHALLASGNLADGWREYDWRWRAKRFRVPPRDFAIPRWQGEDLSGKAILIWSEQGIGDKILFAGLLPELAVLAGSVTVEIEERLVALLCRSFPNIRVVPRRDPVDPALAPEAFDVQAPIGDLPRYLRPTLDGFRPLGPYLKADPAQTEVLRRRYGTSKDAQRQVCLGIAWASRPPKGLPLTAFTDLLRSTGVRWVSLQYGDRASEIAETERNLGMTILRDPAIDPLADFDGSVAQTAALDGVVTIQNATLYTAAGLGVPTFALTPPEPDWRWLGCGHSPWHETVRLYRQDREGADAALARLTSDVKAWLDQRPR